MKIKLHHWQNRDYEIREEMFINGKSRQYVGPCEPEDAIIGRDLVSCGDIVEFMREAHKAGAAGEPFEVEEADTDPGL
jgi:hypothetical protein